jgi:hypothetical protein
MWVGKQRQFHANNKIPIYRKELLDELRFAWKASPKFGGRSSSVEKDGGIDEEDSKGPLDDIGFVWRVDKSDLANNPLWNQNYANLVEFKRKNGHCLVPQRYKEDASLGKWVGTQRGYHTNNKLRLDRKVLLDELGFVWRVKRPRTCLAESEQIAARTNPRGGAIGSRSYVEKDGGRDDEDSKPSLVTSSSALVASYPDQEVVQDTHNTIPSGWNVSWQVG